MPTNAIAPDRLSGRVLDPSTHRYNASAGIVLKHTEVHGNGLRPLTLFRSRRYGSLGS